MLIQRAPIPCERSAQVRCLPSLGRERAARAADDAPRAAGPGPDPGAAQPVTDGTRTETHVIVCPCLYL